jgi:uncharacterized protein (DUF433 family)
MNHWQERITTNPHVCHGKPCIRGTRIMVSVIAMSATLLKLDENLAQSPLFPPSP